MCNIFNLKFKRKLMNNIFLISILIFFIIFLFLSGQFDFLIKKYRIISIRNFYIPQEYLIGISWKNIIDYRTKNTKIFNSENEARDYIKEKFSTKKNILLKTF